MNSETTLIKTVCFSIAGNICLAIIKWLAGIFGHSYALIADAIESTADICSSILVLLGLQYMIRPADENHPYGHGKIEPLITFLVVGFLVASALGIAYHSLTHLGADREPPRAFTLYVLALIIIWKEASFRIILKKAMKTNSASLKAEAWHHRSDAITSIAAFIGISIALVFGTGYESADNIAALFASACILYHSYLIFRPALGEVMDEHVHHDLVDLIRKTALEVKGIENTEKCFIRKSGMQYHVDLHARVNGNLTVREGHDIAHALKNTLKMKLPQLGNILIHIEPTH